MFLLNCYVDIALMLVSVCNEMITNVMNEITCAMMRYVIFSSFLVFVSHFKKKLEFAQNIQCSYILLIRTCLKQSYIHCALSNHIQNQNNCIYQRVFFYVIACALKGTRNIGAIGSVSQTRNQGSCTCISFHVSDTSICDIAASTVKQINLNIKKTYGRDR